MSEDIVAMVLLLLHQGLTVEQICLGMKKRYGIEVRPDEVDDIRDNVGDYLREYEKAREVMYMVSDGSTP